MSDIKDRFVSRCAELWDAHEGEFMSVLEDSENKRVNLTFRAELDFSESTAKLTTAMSFSQVMKDRKEDDFDDPNAPALPGLERENKKKGKGAKGEEQPPDGKAAAAGEEKD